MKAHYMYCLPQQPISMSRRTASLTLNLIRKKPNNIMHRQHISFLKFSFKRKTIINVMAGTSSIYDKFII